MGRLWVTTAVLLVGCELQARVADAPLCGVTPCQANETCVNGACVPTTTGGGSGGGGNSSQCGACAGCCQGSFCMSGTSVLSCGSGGQQCLECQTNERCVAGACTRCTSSNCSGCCNFIGECEAGDRNTSCGRNGGSCGVCTGFTSCASGVCR